MRAGLVRAAPIVVILLTALALRLWGITWGLPDARQLGSYHPDELVLVSAAAGVDLPGLQLNPHFYNYPSLFIYTVSLAYTVADGWGLMNSGRIADLYLIARLLSVLFGVAAVYAIYWAGNRFFGRGVGLIAAGIMAIMPLHVQYSHFVAVDVPAVFFVAAALGASALLLRSPLRLAPSSGEAAISPPLSRGDERGVGGLRLYILAGALSGLAAGTKYNCGLILLSVVAAGVLSQGTTRRSRVLGIGAAILAAVLAFLLVTPGAVLWPGEFLRDFMFEVRHTATGHGYVFEGVGPGWLFTIKSSLAGGMGWPLLAVSLASIVYALLRRRKEDLVILAFVLPYYIVISLSAVNFARYTLPLFPPLAILVASWTYDLLIRSRPVRSTWFRRALVAGTALVAIFTLTYSTALVRLFTVPDPRDSAAIWFFGTVGQEAPIAFPTVPWFYTPPLAPGFGLLRASDRLESMVQSSYTLLADGSQDWNAALIRETWPEYIVISDYEMIDAVRADAPGAREYMRLVEERYRRAAIFRSSLLPSLFGPTTSLPHDMRYAAPTIEVFSLKPPPP